MGSQHTMKITPVQSILDRMFDRFMVQQPRDGLYVQQRPGSLLQKCIV